MNTEHLMKRLELISPRELNQPRELLARGLRALKAATAVALLTTVVACSAGGPATTVNQPTSSNTSTANAYTGPAAGNADVQAFKINLWENIRPSNRCGGCHHQGGQSPMFARSDDVNLAYAAVGPLINFSNPAQSTLVKKVGSGHNCWLADPQACADTMLTWIKNWVGGGSAAQGVTLVPPPDQNVGGSKLFPADSTQFQALIWTPILRQYCVGCHRPDSATPQTPYFASSDPSQAYLAAQSKINLDSPDQSRFVVRLRDEFHHCWPTTSGGAPDCPGSAAAMLAAITAYANGIPVTNVDPTLVLSKSLALKQGTIASGGNRYEANIIAKYEFKTGTGNTAYDTSGVNPSADLSLSGNVGWVGGWGITVGMGGKAQASTAASQKLAQLIQSTGEYSIEVWAAPANVAQTNAYILSYSGSNTTRDMTLGQRAMQYEARTRSDKTDTNGTPALLTAAMGNFAQAALQHVVLTYDPVHGQKIYVNGAYTGDADPSGGGSLANWDSTFALVLGNETTGTRQWQGVIKFAAVHNRALTADQIQQNFSVGVGERYYLLFNVSALTGISKSYIMMEGSQYDSYSYLLNKPTFIVLDPNAPAPSSLAVSGLRIGVNGSILTVGQSYSTLNATIGGSSYTAAGGQMLSGVGAVVAANKGPDSDQLFISFDQLGTHTHAYVEPTYTAASIPPDNTPRPDMGVRTFGQINATLSKITGVPVTDTVVATLFNSQQQSLPAAPQINAFLSSHQTAISQLAGAYCSELVGNAAYRDAFFGNGLDANLTASAASFFGTSANRNLVITPLVAKSVGTSVYPATRSAAQSELDALLQRIPTLNSAATVSTATQAACAAMLGSAAVSMQ